MENPSEEEGITITNIARELLEAEIQMGEKTEESNVWDMEPMIFVVFNPREPFPSKKRVVVFDTPSKYWQEFQPPQVISAIAEIIADQTKPDPPLPFKTDAEDKVLGVIIRTEGWGVDARLDGPEAEKALGREVMEWVEQGKSLVDHPAAIEQKMFFAVEAEGFSGWYQHRHKEIEPFPTNEDGTAEGRVPDATRALFDALVQRYNNRDL